MAEESHTFVTPTGRYSFKLPERIAMTADLCVEPIEEELKCPKFKTPRWVCVTISLTIGISISLAYSVYRLWQRCPDCPSSPTTVTAISVTDHPSATPSSTNAIESTPTPPPSPPPSPSPTLTPSSPKPTPQTPCPVSPAPCSPPASPPRAGGRVIESGVRVYEQPDPKTQTLFHLERNETVQVLNQHHEHKNGERWLMVRKELAPGQTGRAGWVRSQSIARYP
jgi:hypothetical protein